MARVPTRVRAVLASYSWLGFALTDKSTDDLFVDELRDYNSQQRPLSYDPVKYESLLADVSDLLDRCLTYRREYEELSATAIRQGLEYQLFKAQQPAVQALEMAAWLADQRSSDAQAQAKVAEKFSATSGGALEMGFQSAALAAQSSAELAAANERERQNLVAGKWAVLVAYQDSLEDRHTTKGHPLNYAERAARVRKFMMEDFREAVEKSFSIGAGVSWVHGVAPPPAWTTSAIPLDDLVSWVRGIIRELDRRSHSETKVIFSWSVPTNKIGSWPNLYALGAPGASHPVGQARAEGWTSIRVRSISLRFSLQPGISAVPSLVSSRTGLFLNGRPPIIFDDVTTLWSDAQTSTAGKQVLNVPLFSAEILASLNSGNDWPDAGWKVWVDRLVYADATHTLDMPTMMSNSGLLIRVLALAERASGF